VKVEEQEPAAASGSSSSSTQEALAELKKAAQLWESPAKKRATLRVAESPASVVSIASTKKVLTLISFSRPSPNMRPRFNDLIQKHEVLQTSFMSRQMERLISAYLLHLVWEQVCSSDEEEMEEIEFQPGLISFDLNQMVARRTVPGQPEQVAPLEEGPNGFATGNFGQGPETTECTNLLLSAARDKAEHKEQQQKKKTKSKAKPKKKLKPLKKRPAAATAEAPDRSNSQQDFCFLYISAGEYRWSESHACQLLEKLLHV